MNLRVSGAAFVMAAALCSGPAVAADLGGDCCADLEERVSELEATTVRKGNRKVSVTVYGQVNTALMFFDTEVDSDVFVVDNNNSNSRFGLTGTAKISPTLTAGFLLEIAAGLGASSSEVSEDDDDGGVPGDNNVQVRHANWWLTHAQLGRLTVGRGDMATSGIAEIDLGGTNVVTLSGINIGNNLTVGGDTFETVATGNYEFNRNNMIRYDTPTFAGFQASTSFGENDRWDVTLRYAGELSGFRLAAGIGYGVDTDELGDNDIVPPPTNFDEQRIFLGSASVLHVASGIFVTGIAAQRTTEFNDGGDDKDEFYWGLRGGIAKNWFGIGKTIPYVEYNAWDNELVDNEATMWGFGIVQNIDAAAMELYLSYKNLSVDDPQVGTINEDAHIVFSGARIKF